MAAFEAVRDQGLEELRARLAERGLAISTSEIRECPRHPIEGIGKPEPLKGDLAGFWSRRIDRAHRLVYRATPGPIEIVQCRYHY